MFDSQQPMTADRTLALYRTFYQQNGPDLPAGKPSDMQFVDRLSHALDGLEGLILDSYGVIGLGEAPIEGIVNLFEVAAQKQIAVVILTNGASKPAHQRVAGYQNWGLPIVETDIVSSRDAAYHAMAQACQQTSDLRISYLGRYVTAFADLPGPIIGEPNWETGALFAFLGAIGWDEDHQEQLEAALHQTGGKLLVGNPDVSAPSGGGFSFEPGFWAMRAQERTGCELIMTGKPYRPAFELAFRALEAKAGRRLDRAKVGMVGDSLHTDILGAKSYGLQAILLSGYGLLKGRDVTEEAERAQIYPDLIAQWL